MGKGEESLYYSGAPDEGSCLKLKRISYLEEIVSKAPMLFLTALWM